MIPFVRQLTTIVKLRSSEGWISTFLQWIGYSIPHVEVQSQSA